MAKNDTYCTCPKCGHHDVSKKFRMTRQESGRINGLKGRGIKKGTGSRAQNKKAQEKQKDAIAANIRTLRFIQQLRKQQNEVNSND